MLSSSLPARAVATGLLAVLSFATCPTTLVSAGGDCRCDHRIAEGTAHCPAHEPAAPVAAPSCHASPEGRARDEPSSFSGPQDRIGEAVRAARSARRAQTDADAPRPGALVVENACACGRSHDVGAPPHAAPPAILPPAAASLALVLPPAARTGDPRAPRIALSPPEPPPPRAA